MPTLATLLAKLLSNLVCSSSSFAISSNFQRVRSKTKTRNELRRIAASTVHDMSVGSTLPPPPACMSCAAPMLRFRKRGVTNKVSERVRLVVGSCFVILCIFADDARSFHVQAPSPSWIAPNRHQKCRPAVRMVSWCMRAEVLPSSDTTCSYVLA